MKQDNQDESKVEELKIEEPATTISKHRLHYLKLSCYDILKPEIPHFSRINYSTECHYRKSISVARMYILECVWHCRSSYNLDSHIS